MGSSVSQLFRLSGTQLALLYEAVGAGRTVLGPRVRDGAIVYDELNGTEDLPRGYGDEQSPGHYRLVPRSDALRFAYAAPAGPLKRHFHPVREKLVTIRRSKEGLAVEAAPPPRERLALFGVKPCDVEALQRLDTVLRDGAHPDAGYSTRRDGVLVVAAHCQHPAATCFCTSMGTGPSAQHFDLALREDTRPGSEAIFVEVGSAAGQRLLDSLDPKPERASETDEQWAQTAARHAAESVVRNVDAETGRRRLSETLESGIWDELGQRCLACGNCTSSCPTCFCSTVVDTTSLDGKTAERFRQEDSCFNTDFSYMHGGPVRGSTKSRFRQWLTHKFSSWHDQFGESGCVGCGRCIAWCPVAIDMSAEVARLSSDAESGASS